MEMAVLEILSAPKLDGPSHYVAASLVAYVVKEIGAEAAISKEKRIAAEQREAAVKGKSGEGKGGKAQDPPVKT